MTIYDTLIIGGGPAGIMAAYAASQQKQTVVLLEKNDTLGKKLLITGKGRCNVTNAETDKRKFIEQLGANGKFFYSPLSRFGNTDIIKLLQSQSVKTVIERGKRVFPESNQADSVLKALENLIKTDLVTIIKSCAVEKLITQNQHIQTVQTTKGNFSAKRVILATGGVSYPGTGSSGDGYRLAAELGHSVIEPQPALVGLELVADWLEQTPGVELKNVTISAYQNNKKQLACFGEALLTHVGISGPIILDMSKQIGKLLQVAPVQLHIDFKPALDYPQLNKRVIKDILKLNNKTASHIFDELLPKRLRLLFLEMSAINPNKRSNEISKDERKKIVGLLKDFIIDVKKTESIDKAIITSGGIDLKEIDSKTMKSKLIDNLYFAGEIIDLDGPTGGFNLQICWSTGFVAGNCFE